MLTGMAETKAHQQRLEQQGEATVRARPRHTNLLDPAPGAAHAWHTGVQVGLVLEEVEMAPRHLFGVVGRAVGRAADRAGKAAAGGEVDLDISRRAAASKSLRVTDQGGTMPRASCSRLVSRMAVSRIAPTCPSVAPCSPPSRTLRAARRWPSAILDRGCARRHAESGRDGETALSRTEKQPFQAQWPLLPTPNSEEAIK